VVNILHVDDDRCLLSLSKQFFEAKEKDFTIFTAYSVREALDVIANNHIDIIICDYTMPGENGLELLTTIRGDGIKIPFILCTGHKQHELIKVPHKYIYHEKSMDGLNDMVEMIKTITT
jgi:DNA-binding NtrC family response regulator